MSYSVKEAAYKLEVSEITLRRIILKGGINYHKIGKMYRLTEDDIRSYIKSTTRQEDNGAGEIPFPGTISLNEEIIESIENETGNLRHGL